MSDAKTTLQDETELRYVHDGLPGIKRRRAGKGFTYVDANGKPVSDHMRRRIEALVIPPAWEDVWICPFEKGHIQAVGYDEKGRKQYLYHPDWHRLQGETKFDRMIEFAHHLPALRDSLRADLAKEGLPREKVVAAVVRAMDLTFTRVGSASYAKENESYGMSTLKNAHVVSASDRRVRFRFPAKSGKVQEVTVEDPRVARVIRRCQELPGERLFEYEDEEGKVCEVDSADVNEYLRDVMGHGFTSKDFRTWAASALMIGILHEAGDVEDRKEREVIVREAVKEVAKRLGNTVAVCKKSYINPVVPAAYLDGSFERRIRKGDAPNRGLWPEERLTLHLLESYAGPPTN